MLESQKLVGSGPSATRAVAEPMAVNQSNPADNSSGNIFEHYEICFNISTYINYIAGNC